MTPDPSFYLSDEAHWTMDEPDYFPDSSEPTRPPATAISIPNLASELELPTSTVVAGDIGHATLVLRNTGLAAIDFESDSILVGHVSNNSKGAVVTDVGFVAGTGLRIQLAYKQELEIPVIFGTSSHRHEDGHIPPGAYLVGVQLPVRNQGDTENPRVIEVPAVEVAVVAPDK
jgi:hypothetical protein